MASVYVQGLADLRRDLKEVEDPMALPELRDGLKGAADIVAQAARARVPRDSGKAAGSIRATAGGNRAYVVGGRASVPYYGWLDFGSRRPRSGQSREVGPWAKSGTGPKQGRFIYPAIAATDARVKDKVADALDKALDKRGL